MQIITDHKNNRLQELKGYLVKRKHPQKMTTLSQNYFNLENTTAMTYKILLPLLELTILIINFFSTNIKIALKSTAKKTYDTNILFTVRKPKKLRNMLVRPKFETKMISRSPELTGLFLCNNYVYHKAGYIIHCPSISFKLTNVKTVLQT